MGSSIIRRSSGSGERRACGSLGVSVANASVPRPSTRRQRPRRTCSAQSISSSTPTSKAQRSRSAPSSMNTPANASAGSWNAPSPPTGSPTTPKSLSHSTALPPRPPRTTYAALRSNNVAGAHLRDDHRLGRHPHRAVLHPASLTPAQRVPRIVQQPPPRPVLEHQQLLPPDPHPRPNHRLEKRAQPHPATLTAGLPHPPPSTLSNTPIK